MFSLTGSESSFTLCSFEDLKAGEDRSINLHNKVYRIDSPKTKKAIIKDVVKGTLPIRNISVKDNYDSTLGGIKDI
jgi:hypothetical protein